MLLRDRAAANLRIRNFAPRTVECFVRQLGPAVGPGSLSTVLGHLRGSRRAPTLHDLTAATIVDSSWMPVVGAQSRRDRRQQCWSASSFKPWGTF